MKQTTEKQHINPRCHLKSFGEKLWVFDKTKMSWNEKKESNKTISTILNFYEHPSLPTNEIENYLSRIESDWSVNGRDKLLENITDNKYMLSFEDKEIWSKFMWVQSLRTPSHMSDNETMFNLLSDYVDDSGVTQYLTMDNKLFSLDMIKDIEKDKDYRIFIDSYYWVILKPSFSNHKFFTADNSVITETVYEKYKNYEIPVTRKYLTISPDACILLVSKKQHNGDLIKYADKITYVDYRIVKIIYNEYIHESLKDIYVNTERQIKYINSYIKKHKNIERKNPRLEKINDNLIRITK